MLFDVLIYFVQALIGSVFIFLPLLQLQVQFFLTLDLWAVSPKKHSSTLHLPYSSPSVVWVLREETRDEDDILGYNNETYDGHMC